tara:strand:- start:782 stop:2086 length:1305 start_codon:yes stop_codon:yes gene_type:complete
MEKRSLNKINILIVLLLTLLAFTHAQRMSRSKKQRTNVEKFVLAPFADAISSDSIRIVTYIEIPFYSLQFIKKGSSLIASYQASISIKDKKGKDLEHIIWSDSIITDIYTDTRSVVKNRKHFTEFVVSKGSQYELIGELQDLDTRKKGILKKKVDYREYDRLPSLMEPNYLLDLSGDWGFGRDKIPTRGYRVREIGDGIDLKITGFVNPGDYEVNIFLSNGTIIDSLVQRFTGVGNKGYFNEMIFIPATKFSALKNDFRIELSQGKKTVDKISSFSRNKPGISNYVYDIDLALKQMKYILQNDERSMLKKKSKNDKEELFFSLWKDRDPTPETDRNELMEEYYERVSYVNEHFDGWQPGWETDQGMIYILFGPPDEIQRTNSASSNSSFWNDGNSATSLYQVWSYYTINKQFVFRDQNGFGDYRLNTPFFGAGL